MKKKWKKEEAEGMKEGENKAAAAAKEEDEEEEVVNKGEAVYFISLVDAMASCMRHLHASL